jgi:CubicO group peptidase (beta-lactamase class C family)
MHHSDWPTNGWSIVPPEEQAMRPTILAMIDPYVAEHFPTLLSLVVVRHGMLVFERYYHHWRAEDRVNVKSATKSIVSALVGIALRERFVTSLDQRLYEFFPHYFPAHSDPRKREITLKHLLTLRSGLAWVEQESVGALFTSDNWVQYGLSLPLWHAPGEVYAYSTLDAHLLSAVLSQVTGASALTFANASLFGPMGSSLTQWAHDPQGYPIGGSELYLTPYEMTKFGYLYLRRGVWDGEQIIPEAYLEASIHTQVSTGISAVADPNVTLSETYGYLWWVSRVGPYTSFFALGYGGQTIYVIPELDVVLVTAAQWKAPVEQGAGLPAFTMAHALAEQFVLPALAP